jgi:hypothetical protein
VGLGGFLWKIMGIKQAKSNKERRQFWRMVLTLPDQIDGLNGRLYYLKRQLFGKKSEKLEYVPASFYVKKYARYKYACKACESHISIGQMPPIAIDKGILDNITMCGRVAGVVNIHMVVKSKCVSVNK